MGQPTRTPASAPRPVIAVGSLGGTITMTANAQGRVAPTMSAKDLIDGTPGLSGVADIEVETLKGIPGASLSYRDVLDSLSWARAAVAGGADGVVLVQGTDTLEETAYLLDLYWELPNPLVVTGAMRPPGHAGADGPANVLAAVTASAAPQCGDAGVLVVLNDEVHAASRVRKTHSTSLGAFSSPSTGPVGHVTEGRVLMTLRPDHLSPIATPSRIAVRVALIEATLDDGGDLLAAVAGGDWDGAVVAAFGAGHVPSAWVDVLDEALARMPVVIASRTGAGSTLTRTYGFSGSESDLLLRGAVMAGCLDARKARLLLSALLANGSSRGGIEREFAARGSCHV